MRIDMQVEGGYQSHYSFFISHLDYSIGVVIMHYISCIIFFG
jgi:hypothetical protein